MIDEVTTIFISPIPGCQLKVTVIHPKFNSAVLTSITSSCQFINNKSQCFLFFCINIKNIYSLFIQETSWICNCLYIEVRTAILNLGWMMVHILIIFWIWSRGIVYSIVVKIGPYRQTTTVYCPRPFWSWLWCEKWIQG